MPLTARVIIVGINIIFCNNIVENINNIDFPVPKVAVIADIVYPIQYPLYPITRYINGTPITVEPRNHSNIAMQVLLIIEEMSNSFVEIL